MSDKPTLRPHEDKRGKHGNHRKRRVVVWIGSVSKCDNCAKPINDNFYDCNSQVGWMLACPECFKLYGVGLGMGMGQHYRKMTEGEHAGKFVKVAG